MYRYRIAPSSRREISRKGLTLTTLTVIAEPFPNWETKAQAAATRDLISAIAETAPRGCGARMLLGRGTAAPEFPSPLIRADHLPIPASMLPLVWQSGTTARPLDGEFAHAPTPLMPLRSRGEDDGSQTSVTVSHSIAWESPELIGTAQARLYRSYVRRAMRLADVVLTSTHATARLLEERYGSLVPVQVLQLAAPSEFRDTADHARRRADLGLPERYLLTTAAPGSFGRLEWALNALSQDPTLPQLVVLAGVDPHHLAKHQDRDRPNTVASAIPSELADRVTVVTATDLADIGAALTGAAALLQPQAFADSGFTVLGALAAAVPVVHAGNAATTELVLDGGIAVAGESDFAAELTRIFAAEGELDNLSVLARDRSRSFSWQATAWQLWETHANL